MASEARVFCSYSRRDSDFIRRLATDLRSAGLPLWLDQLDITAGERWDRSIQDALTSADRLLVVLSPDSVASDNVMDEVSYALEEGKAVIPVLLRQCEIPFRLRRLQFIDFTQDYNAGLQDLRNCLQSGPVKGAAPTVSKAVGESARSAADSASTRTKRSPVVVAVVLAAIAIVGLGFAAREFFPGNSKDSDRPVVSEGETAKRPKCNPSVKPFEIELYAAGSDCHVVPDLRELEPAARSNQWTIDIAKTTENNPLIWGYQTGNNWSARITAHFEVRRPGPYTFYVTIADSDAAWLKIGDATLLRTGCTRTPDVKTFSETVDLDAGFHKLELLYGDDGWWDALQLQYSGPDTEDQVKVLAPPAAIYCES